MGQLMCEALHLAPGLRDLDYPAAALIERPAKIGRKLGDLGVQCRLRQMQARGGAREVAQFRELREGGEGVPGGLAQQVHYSRFLYTESIRKFSWIGEVGKLTTTKGDHHETRNRRGARPDQPRGRIQPGYFIHRWQSGRRAAHTPVPGHV